MAKPQHQLLTRLTPLAFALAMGWATTGHAQMPTAGSVVIPGSATINTSDPRNYVITQQANKAIINWDSFSIGSGNSVRFLQPSSSSIVLNRVVGLGANNVSNIYGSLSSNGQVFLVNPNGVYFAPGASLDVGGLVATSLNISDSDFLAGRYLFTRDASSTARADVINAGIIRAREGGYVVLAGDYTANSGVIEAKLGTAMLGSANSFTLDIVGDGLVNYTLNERNMTALAGVSNSGQLLADGGRVIMTASTARSLTSAAVNNSGVIQAHGVGERNGEIYLLADDGAITLDASSKLDVSGDTGGGKVLVGGNQQGSGSEVHASSVSMAAGATINADANVSGNGGQVVVWSDGTTQFAGSISARGGATSGDGGSVEVSGKHLDFAGTVDTLAPKGKTGTLLLDPADITISNAADSDISASAPFKDATDNGGTSNLNITTLQTALASSNVTVTTTTTSGASAGNITLVDALTWSTGNSLSLIAANQILINNTISATSGALVLNAGAGVTQTAAIAVNKLALLGTGAFTLNNANNDVRTFAANVTGAVDFNTLGTLTVGSTGGATGVTSGANAIKLQSGSTMTVSNVVTATGNDVTLKSGGAQALNATVSGNTVTLDSANGASQSGKITAATGLAVLGGGNFSLNNVSNAVSTVAADITGSLSLKTDGTLDVGTVTSGSTPIVGVKTGTGSSNIASFNIGGGGTLTQSQLIQTGGLAVRAADSVTLSNAGNDIRNVAASIATSGKTFSLTNGSTADLNTATVDGLNGISTNNGDITLTHTAGTIWFGDGGTNSGVVNAGTGTVTLDAGQLKQRSGAITADKLAVTATGFASIAGTDNNVNTIAANVTGGNVFEFKNSKALSIGTVGATSGITTDGGNVAVTAKSTLNVNNAIATSGGDAILTTTGDINIKAGIDAGTGTVGLISSGSGTIDADTVPSSITAGALALEGGIFKIDRNSDGLLNSTGRFDNIKKIAASTSDNFQWTTNAELTVGDYAGVSGITAGHVYLNTGVFSGFDINTPYTDAAYYDSTTGKFKAGLVLESGINATGHSVYLNSASGIFQWAFDNSAAVPASRTVAKITANYLMVNGRGQFSLMLADNQVNYFAASTEGSVSLANSTPLTIDTLSFGLGAITKTITGITTTTELLTSGPNAGGYSQHNILLSAADDPNGGVNALTINQNITAGSVAGDTSSNGSVNLSVGASDNHKTTALVQTTGSAVVTGGVLLLGSAEGRGTFNIKSNVTSLAAAGGYSMLVDNTLQTGNLNILGLGSAQGGGTPTPVGNVYISTGGDMLLLGGKSTGDYLQLRANQLDVLGTMEMKDGASVLLQPLDMNRMVGVHNANDYQGYTVDTNYSRSLLQNFSQTAAFYVGSTPAVMNNDATVPSAVKNLVLNNQIRIGADGSGGLELGYRSLSAESAVSIWAGYIGDVYNLRLVAPSVSIGGFNVTGNELNISSDNLTLYGTADQYQLVANKTTASNTMVTLRAYSDTANVWIGDKGNVGSVPQVQFSYDLLRKFPDYTNFVFSGTTDQPLAGTADNDFRLGYGVSPEESLGNRTLTLSAGSWVYAYNGTSQVAVFGDVFSGSGGLNSLVYDSQDWNSGNYPKVAAVAGSRFGWNETTKPNGAFSPTWGGCPDFTSCQGTNTSVITGPGGNPVTPLPPTTNPNTCTGSSCSGGGSTPPAPPPATPPTDPTSTTTNNANNTNTNSNNNNTNSNSNNGTSTNTNTNTNSDPSDGSDDVGPSGGGNGFNPNNGNNGPTDGNNTSGTDPGNNPNSSSGSNGSNGSDNTSGGNNNTSSGNSNTGSNNGSNGDDGSNNGSNSGDNGNSSNSSGTSGNSNGSDGSGTDISGNGSNGGNGNGDGTSNGANGAGSGSGNASNGDGSDGSGTSSSGNGNGTDSSGNSGDGSGSNGNMGGGSGNGDGASNGANSGSGNDSNSAADSGDGSGTGGSGKGSGSGNSGAGDSGNGDGTGSAGDNTDSSGSGKANGDGSDMSGAGSKSDGSGGAGDADSNSGNKGSNSDNSGAVDSGNSGDAGNTGGNADSGGSGKANGDGGNASGTGSKNDGSSGAGDSDGNATASGNKSGGDGDGSDGNTAASGKHDGSTAGDDGDGQNTGSGKQTNSGGMDSDESGSGHAKDSGGQDEGSAAGGSGDAADSGASDGSDKSGSGPQNGSSAGDSSGAGSGSSSSNTSLQEHLCVGQQQDGQRQSELPEQSGALANRPLVEVRNGGVNLDSDCGKQAQPVSGGAHGK